MINDKPGVLGAVGNLGNTIKQGTVSEVKKTVSNTVEQLSGNEKKEMAPADAAASAEAMRKHSQDTVSWLYGTPSNEALPPLPTVPEKPAETKTASIGEQLGVKNEPNPNTANAVEQIGFGKSNQQTASATEQLNLNPTPNLTPEQQQKQAQLGQQLHNEYYQKLTTPQSQPDTEQRQKDVQEDLETTQERMQRLEQEDLQEKQKKKEEQAPAVDQSQNMEKHRGSMG